MKHYPAHLIERLNSEADLVGIIKKHTVLKPAGVEFKGCCPFHGEKTPSFFVNPQTNLYYCFGCGAKGNAISFLVDFERLSFVEAVKELSQRTGIELPAQDDKKYQYARKSKSAPAKAPLANPISAKPISAKTASSAHLVNSRATSSIASDNALAQSSFGDSRYQSEDGYEVGRYDQADDGYHNHAAAYSQPSALEETTNWHKETSDLYEETGDLYELLEQVAKFYQEKLQKNLLARNYLVQRGLSEQSIIDFGLGYAPEGWQHLQEAFAKESEGLTLLGLIRKSKSGRVFNLFRERIMFPIKDRQGRVVGFAGRALDDTVLPKYLNSTDSVVFNKQHILYGFYEARQKRATNWLLVEGYLDVIALYQAGIYGAVAPMGTALGEQQIKALLRLTDTLTLCFDGDNAGQKAAMRAVSVAMPILPDDKTLRFLMLPSEHDPDSYVKAYGKHAMQALINKALSLSDFLYHHLSLRYDLTLPEQKAAAMAQFKALTQTLPKGSSLRFWLNGDMYERLRGKKSPKVIGATTTRLYSTQEQLWLTLLYSPHCLQENPLETLYQSVLPSLEEPHDVPKLPDWEALGLVDFVAAVQTLLPFLHTPDSLQAIDANAHMVLSALGDPVPQNTLKTHWRDFATHAYAHPAEDAKLLLQELLCQRVVDVLQEQQANCQSLALANIYKKRILAFRHFDQTKLKPLVNQEYLS